ncbi:MAG: hypothetical protein IH944_00410 [Armatimonadetes bacterium]|nr:hypothetical protein [Armatimonadota bacterium]
MKKILAIMAVVLVSGIVSAQNMFTNGDFETGSLQPWTIVLTSSNAITGVQDVTLFDMDFSGPGSESLAARFDVGRIEGRRGAEGIEMTQELNMIVDEEYVLSFDWASSRTEGGTNSEGGLFSIIVDGTALATADSGPTGPGTENYGNLTVIFTPASTGVFTVGVRIVRAGFGPADIFQHADNISAIGPEETVVPDSFSLFRGVLTGGGLSDLLASDDSWMTVLPGITLNQAERQVQLIVTGTSPTETPSELRIRVEAHAEINNIGQWIELWNYDTSSWEEVDFMIATLADSIVEVRITVDPGRFIEAGTKNMKAKVSYKEAGIVLFFPWLISFDQTVWVIVP